MLKPRYSCLFIANRIPYPPDRGDKARALAWLRRLAEHYDVTLLAGVDDVDDWRWREEVEAIAQEVRLAPAGGLRGKMRGAPSLMRGKPLSTAYFRNPEAARALRDQTRERAFDLVFVYSTAAAAYLDDLAQPPRAVIVDFVDVDSAKWESLAQSSGGPMGWVYAREAAALKIFEAELAGRAQASLFATRAEAELFSERTGVTQGVSVVETGVDAAHWAAAAETPSPYADDRPTIVMTGAMDTPPNVDAALWLHDQVLPLIRRHAPETRFALVGARPTPELRALAKGDPDNPDNIVTGHVDDLRPWLGHATIAAAPMRVARGLQNKVLEAMAAGAPALATPQALAGLDAAPGTHLEVAEGADAFADVAVRLLKDAERRARLSAAAKTHVAERYDWSLRHAAFDAVVEAALSGDREEESEAEPSEAGSGQSAPLANNV